MNIASLPLNEKKRRRIGTLAAMPALIARWTTTAKRLSAHVHSRLQSARQWAAVGDQPVFVAKDQNTSATTSNARGRVTLVGAGPGDAEYLTLKAVRALQTADVILFDALVSHEVLELACKDAKRLLVGKRGGRKSCRQEDINETMVTLAKAGNHVVRLKGGDPMIFGRGGEEIERLRAENIPVTVVPGITSALAMASTLATSLTHRDHAQSVRFVTGHSRKGELPADIDWQAIADPRTTTIFYMGGRTAAAISETLIANGLPPETPAVMVSAITRPDEKRWRGTLATLEQGPQSLGPDNPILIGIGTVFQAPDMTTESLDQVVDITSPAN